MKNVLSVLCVVFLMNTASVNAQQRIKFYYYPSANLYYNTATGQYAYLNNGTWVTSKALPRGMTVRNTQRHVVYNASPEVWVNNQAHVTRYKSNGKTKVYKNSPNGNAYGRSKSHGNGKAKGKVKN